MDYSLQSIFSKIVESLHIQYFNCFQVVLNLLIVIKTNVKKCCMSQLLPLLKHCLAIISATFQLFSLKCFAFFAWHFLLFFILFPLLSLSSPFSSQTQYLTLPKSPSPVNLPLHYTPAISASPLRQVDLTVTT